MAWQVTVNSGLKEVVLPDGLRYQGGAVVVLNDAQYGSMSANAVATLFSSVTQLGGGGGGGGGGGSVSATGGGKETIGALGNVTGAATVNLADGNVFTATMTGNTTFTFSGATGGVACSFALYLSQDGTGGRAATWPGSVTWVGGTAPAPSTAASALNLYVFESLDGGTTWHGSLVQELPSWALPTASAAILALLAGGVTLPAYIAPKAVTLTGTAPSVNAALGNVFTHALAGNTTYPAPSNPLEGQKIEFHTRQPASGGPYTVTFATGSAGDYSGGSGSIPAASTAANALDVFAFTYSALADAGAGAWCCLNSGGLGY